MRRILPLAFAFLCLPIPVRAGTANSLLDLTPDGRRLLVANTDSGTVTVVDTGERKALREFAVGDHPEGVAWVGTGPLAVVTIFRDDQVVLVNTETGQVEKRLTVADEPYGVVVDRAGTRAWVTHDYPGVVSEIDLKTFTVTRQMLVQPFLRGIALAHDERRLLVSGYYSGALYAVDLADGKVADTWPGAEQDNLARHVALHPTRDKAYLAHSRSRITAAHGSGSIFPHLTAVDLVPPGKGDRRRTTALDSFNNVTFVPCNPWETALSPDGKRLYILYAGTNDLNVCKVLDDDYQEIDRVGLVVPVGKNPRALHTSPDGKLLYVYNAMDFDISVLDTADMKPVARIKTCDAPMTPEWVRGKILFNTALAPMTRQRWIACSSCHPDGHHDGRTWQNPEGLRKTTALFGLAHTHPLHWSADRDEVQDFEYTIRGKLMGGRGLLSGSMKPKRGCEPVELEENLAGRSPDLDALAIYCNSFTYTLSPHIPAPGKLSEAAERGKAIFFGKETACASCHSGPYYTDSKLTKPFNVHDVGTGDADPTEKMGPKYDTPTLLGIYRQTAYLHHGKAKTLMDVLTTCNPQDRHGKTSHLTAEQRDDLVAFLKSLPYEPPPDETPNTVKDRVPAKPTKKG